MCDPGDPITVEFQEMLNLLSCFDSCHAAYSLEEELQFISVLVGVKRLLQVTVGSMVREQEKGL